MLMLTMTIRIIQIFEYDMQNTNKHSNTNNVFQQKLDIFYF